LEHFYVILLLFLASGLFDGPALPPAQRMRHLPNILMILATLMLRSLQPDLMLRSTGTKHPSSSPLSHAGELDQCRTRQLPPRKRGTSRKKGCIRSERNTGLSNFWLEFWQVTSTLSVER